MNLSRRSFVRGLSVVSASALLPFPLRALAQEGPVVQTPRGAVRGAVQDGVHVFRGVPCGKNPYPFLRTSTATSGRLNSRNVGPEFPKPRVTNSVEPFFSYSPAV